MRYVNAQQVQQALEKAAEENQKYYMIINTLSSSGLRVTELVTLTPQNINFKDGCFHIKGKGGKIRNVDVSKQVCMQLSMYIKNRKIKNNKPIFPITRQRIFQITKKFADEKPHAFRHGYAIALLRKTKNIRYVQKQLGHTSLSTTQIYLQFLEFEEEKEMLPNLYN